MGGQGHHVSDRSGEIMRVVGLIPQFVYQPCTFIANRECSYEVIPILNIRNHGRTEMIARRIHKTCILIGCRPLRYATIAKEDINSMTLSDAKSGIHLGPIEDTFLRFHIRPADSV